MSRLMQFPLSSLWSVEHLLPFSVRRMSRRGLDDGLDQDREQFTRYNRGRLEGGDGFLFVRFKECNDSTDEWTLEHCVAEGGWARDDNNVANWVTWECPCEGCKAWLTKWRHLFAALWGANRVYELADSTYNELAVATEEEWDALNLEDDFEYVGKDWECIQWDDGYGPDPSSPTEPNSTSHSLCVTDDSVSPLSATDDSVSSMSGSIPSHGYSNTLSFTDSPTA